MKFPTHEEFVKMVAEEALDEFLYDGRSIREWVQIIGSEDAISRQAVLDLVNSDWKYEGLEESINSMPPVTPQPKTGHWTYVFNSTVNGLKVCECDACKKRAYGSTHFCPNCGAKMEVKK